VNYAFLRKLDCRIEDLLATFTSFAGNLINGLGLLATSVDSLEDSPFDP
jgi:hypothetical protein